MTDITLWVDALSPQPGGIGRYTWELCKGLKGHSGVDSVNYFGRNQRIDDPGALLRGEPLPRRRGLRAWWDKRILLNSLVHGPNYFLPDFAGQGVITVHDLSVFRYPETHPADRVRAFERSFMDSLSRALHVITDTETVRGELIETFGIRPESVTSVPLAADARYRPAEPDVLLPAIAQWDLRSGHYGLCVSTLEPRKKIAELMAAWRRLPRAIRDSYPLVLAGGAGWRNEELRVAVEQGVNEGWLKHLGFVDEALLPSLYAGAALFIYPSIYEGFGLPPLEAMASGTPVMVANRSCLPEVCGNAARYIDPDDGDGFLAGIIESLTDREWREQAAQRGLARAAQFRWDRCIDGTVDVYRAAARAV